MEPFTGFLAVMQGYIRCSVVYTNGELIKKWARAPSPKPLILNPIP